MKKVLLLIAIALLVTGCSKPVTQTKSPAPVSTTPSEEITMDTTADSSPSSKKFDAAPGKLENDRIQKKQVVLVTSKGTVRFNLLADEAPLTVSNFVFLTEQKFYDGLTFHRVEPGFVVQGGDPSGNGTGGPGYKFEDEPVKRDYKRGIVAMANSGPNTNGSQFFVMLADTPLPPLYTVFGEVTEGMDVIDNIRVGDTMTSVTIEPQQ